jgi:hypothetical protein
MTIGVGPGVTELPGVGGAAYPEGIKDDQDSACHSGSKSRHSRPRTVPRAQMAETHRRELRRELLRRGPKNPNVAAWLRAGPRIVGAR